MTSSPRDLADLRASIARALWERPVCVHERVVGETRCSSCDADAVLAVVGPHVEALEAALEPGKAPAIVTAMFAEAEQRGMSPFAAKHALSWLLERLDAAEARVEALEAQVEIERRNHRALWDRTLGRCKGHACCTAPIHVHGCFADGDGSRCDDPADHAALAPQPAATEVGRP